MSKEIIDILEDFIENRLFSRFLKFCIDSIIELAEVRIETAYR